MAHFPQTPSFTGFNTPSRIEADIADLQHSGTIPPELNGAFYRVQPDPQFPPRLDDEAGKALFGAYRNPLTDDPSVKGEIRGTANTNAWLFGGKLWALKEDSP